jgi:two-component system response regulator HydG
LQKKKKTVGSNKEIGDIRIITATNEDLREAVKEEISGKIYTTESMNSIHSPSLIERNEDLMLFFSFFFLINQIKN